MSLCLIDRGNWEEKKMMERVLEKGGGRQPSSNIYDLFLNCLSLFFKIKSEATHTSLMVDWVGPAIISSQKS